MAYIRKFGRLASGLATYCTPAAADGPGGLPPSAAASLASAGARTVSQPPSIFQQLGHHPVRYHQQQGRQRAGRGGAKVGLVWQRLCGRGPPQSPAVASCSVLRPAAARCACDPRVTTRASLASAGARWGWRWRRRLEACLRTKGGGPRRYRLECWDTYRPPPPPPRISDFTAE